MAKKNLLKFSIIMLSLLFSLITVTEVFAATVEVSLPTQLTTDTHYDRNPSVFKAIDGKWWLFFARSQTDFNGYGCDESGVPLNCDSDAYDIYYMSSTDNGATWSTETPLSECSVGKRGMDAFQDRSGKIWVFVSDPGPNSKIEYCTSDDNGATWTGPVDTGLKGSHVDALQLSNSYSSDGWIYLVYGFGGIKDAWSSDNGATWVEETIDTIGGLPKAMDVDNKLQVVYVNSGDLYYKFYDRATSSWSATQTLQSSPSLSANDPVIYKKGTGYGIFWAPWDIGTNSQWTESLTSSNGGNTWSSSKHVTDGGYGATYWWDMWPDVLVDGSNLYLFYGSEKGTDRIDGNIFMYKVDWNLANDHYEVIQTAINAATSGDTVNVAAGTYTEHVVISKPLALNGPNKNKNPNNPGRTNEAIILTDDLTNHQAILVDSFNVAINGFTVYGPNGAIKDIGAIGMTNTGPRTNVTIKYNKIYRTEGVTNWNGDGIRLDFPNDDASVTIQYNLINVGNTTMENGNNDITIADMAYTNAHRLTWVVGSADRTKILNNYFYGHSKIYLEGTGAMIDGNRFSGIWGPIEVRGSKDVVIKNNVMIDQTDVGIYVWSPKAGNSGAGLSSDISITNNKIQGMKLDPQDFTDEGTGIILGGVTNALVEKNTIMNNAGNGVVIGGEGYDHFVHTWGLAVGAYQPVNNIIRGNTISGNTLYAVKVDSTVASGSSGNAVYNNNFIDNASPQARDDGLSGAIQWDDGISRGNYWSELRYNGGYPTCYLISSTLPDPTCTNVN